MTAITFDTLKFTKRLVQGGASPELAEATAEAFKDAQHESEVATKADIEQLRLEMHAELRLHRWILMFIVVAIAIPLVKSMLL